MNSSVIINNFLTGKGLYVIVGGMLLLFIFIWICKWSFLKALNYFGVTTIISSICFLFLGVIFDKVLFLFNYTYKVLFKGIVSMISKQMVVNALITFVMGILITFISNLIMNKRYLEKKVILKDEDMDESFIKDVK